MSSSIPVGAQVVSDSIISLFETELKSDTLDHDAVFRKYDISGFDCDAKYKFYRTYAIYLDRKRLHREMADLQEQTVLPLVKNCYPAGDTLVINTYYNLARRLDWLEENKEAEKYYLELARLQANMRESYSRTAIHYSEVAAFYLEQNDPFKSNVYIDKALQAFSSSEYSGDYLWMLRTKGNALSGMEKFTESEEIFRKAAKLLQEHEISNMSISDIVDQNTDHAMLLMKLKSYEQAEEKMLAALKLSPKETDLDKFLYSRVLGRYGFLLREKGSYEKAHKIWNEINAIYGQVPDWLELKDLIALHENQGDTYLGSGETDRALDEYNKAMAISIDYEPTSIFDNPRIKDNVNLHPRHLQRQLGLKSKAYYKSARATGKKEYFEATVETIAKYDTLGKIVFGKNWEEESHQIVLSESRDLYGTAVQAAVELYNITGERHHLASAREMGSRFKAQLLQRGIDIRQKIESQLSEKQIIQEQRLKESYTEAEIAYKDAIINKEDVEVLKKIKNEYFKHKVNYDEFLSGLNVFSSSMFDGKNRVLSNEDLQNSLEDNEAVIEYVKLDSLLYIFSLTVSDFFFEQHKFTTPEIEQYYDQLLSGNSIVESSQLSSKLLSVLDSLPDVVDNLIVIPDQELARIPFEALSLKSGESLNSKFNVSYEYSSSFLDSEQQRQAWNGKVMGMASDYTSDDFKSSSYFISNPLVELPYAVEELEGISSLVVGDYYFNDRATKKSFSTLNQNSSVLHLALHSQLNATYPDLSALIFESDSLDYFLRASEIYNADINTQLTVLSACNSGVGEWRSGDGVRSLARSFIHAGSESVLLSLWEAPDVSTGSIMKEFYKGLKNGLKKNEALRLAKLDYIESVQPSFRHPKYWAHLVLVGSTDPIQLAGSGFELASLKFVLLGVLILILIVFLLKRFK